MIHRVPVVRYGKPQWPHFSKYKAWCIALGLLLMLFYSWIYDERYISNPVIRIGFSGIVAWLGLVYYIVLKRTFRIILWSRTLVGILSGFVGYSVYLPLLNDTIHVLKISERYNEATLYCVVASISVAMYMMPKFWDMKDNDRNTT